MWPAREEARFRATLRSGLAMLESELAGGARTVSGDVAFRLHDTHGFPIELTREIAAEREALVDEAGFERAMRRQREQSKSGAKGVRPVGPADRLDTYRALLEERGPTRFVGYTDNTATAHGRGRVMRHRGRPGRDLPRRHARSTPRAGARSATPASSRPTPGRRGSSDTTYALPGLTRHLATVEEGEIRRGPDGHGHHRRRAARRHPAQPHRHPPAALGPSDRARRPRQAAGFVGGAGPAAIRLHPLQPRDPRGDGPDRGPGERPGAGRRGRRTSR